MLVQYVVIYNFLFVMSVGCTDYIKVTPECSSCMVM
jgi:hypothetical protein